VRELVVGAGLSAEWFDDPPGVPTGYATHHAEVTLGVNWYPVRLLKKRPEVGGDFAGERMFGIGGRPGGRHSQLTCGISFLLKY
jgi:hypothetical protein